MGEYGAGGAGAGAGGSIVAADGCVALGGECADRAKGRAIDGRSG